MIFPALSIIVAKTFSDWLNTKSKEKLLAGLGGIACLTALFVNSTPFQVKVTLTESSKEVRHLASIMIPAIWDTRVSITRSSSIDSPIGYFTST